MSKRLSQYRNLGFLNITIEYGKEVISFNLMDELKVDPDVINNELKTQASKYGFCLLLHKKLLTQYEYLCKRRQKMWAKLFFKAKEQKINGRPYSDDLAKAWVETQSEYVALTKKCINAKDDADTILSCVKSFEQRKDLIQSLSSNIRNEK